MLIISFCGFPLLKYFHISRKFTLVLIGVDQMTSVHSFESNNPSFFFCWKIFFLMWTIFTVFIEFVTILLLFYVSVFWPWGMWDLSSPRRDRTCMPALEDKVLTTGPPGKSQHHTSFHFLPYPGKRAVGLCQATTSPWSQLPSPWQKLLEACKIWLLLSLSFSRTFLIFVLSFACFISGKESWDLSLTCPSHISRRRCGLDAF